MLTLDHYRDVFGNRAFWNAFSNTMLLGVVGATATMALAASSPMSPRAPAGAAAG